MKDISGNFKLWVWVCFQSDKIPWLEIHILHLSMTKGQRRHHGSLHTNLSSNAKDIWMLLRLLFEFDSYTGKKIELTSYSVMLD